MAQAPTAIGNSMEEKPNILYIGPSITIRIRMPKPITLSIMFMASLVTTNVSVCSVRSRH